MDDYYYLAYFFWIIFFFSPIISLIYSLNVRKKEFSFGKRFYKFHGSIFSIALLIISTPVSFSINILDTLIIGIGYFSFSMLAFSILKVKNIWIKISVITISSIIFLFFYLLITIGILGFAFILGDYEIDRGDKLGNNYKYEIYYQGNVTTDSYVQIKIKYIPPIIPIIEYNMYDTTFTHYPSDINVFLDKNDSTKINITGAKKDTTIHITKY